MTIPAPGQNPRYDKTWDQAVAAKSWRFFTRVYSGILPAYREKDLDIWIDKPGHVDMVMQGSPEKEPLTQWRVSMFISDFSAQGGGRRDEEEFFADSPDEIVLIMALSYNIPVKKIGWDF